MFEGPARACKNNISIARSIGSNPGIADIHRFSLTNIDLPSSTNSRFSEFLKKFGGVFLEVFEIISGVFGRFSGATPRNFVRHF